jgi:hypothetical protein
MDIIFNYDKLPAAYLSENKESRKLRSGLSRKSNPESNSKCGDNELHDNYFSDANIEQINKQLIYEVYHKTKKKLLIGPQDPKQLKIVMKFVWNLYAKHLPYQIKQQIKELNCKVVSEIRDGVISNAMQKIDYLVEISTPRKILPLPINVNNLDKQLPPVSEIYHSSKYKLKNKI